MESVTKQPQQSLALVEFWAEHYETALAWAKFMDQQPITGEDVAAALPQVDPDFREWMISSMEWLCGPLDPRCEPPPVPHLGPFTPGGWHFWAARSLTHAMMTVGREAFNDLIARLRLHTPDDPNDTAAQDAWIATAKEIVASWAERWNLSDADTRFWAERWRLDSTSAGLVLPMVFFEARYRLKREKYGEAWTSRNETMRRFANLFELGLVGPLADWSKAKWETEVIGSIDAQMSLPSPSILALTVDETSYSAEMKAQRRRRHAVYKAAGIPATPGQREPRHFQWYIRFQVLEHPYHHIAKDAGVSAKAAWDAVRAVADVTKMPLRTVRRGRQQGR
jgi:hypothetical protein